MSSLEALRRELLDYFDADGLPESGPLNLEVLSRRTFLDYEEWKIEYDVQTPDTMPLSVGRRIPAYLLIPRNRPKPMPAVACFHQCAEDCVVGKEAVVGKVPWVSVHGSCIYESADRRVSIDRSDQAYGYELVHEGFVVIAPDSINCGERNIDAIRKPGEVRICHSIIDPHLGMEADFKRVVDGIRAVDVLESLDFVDPDRIGAVGHSMGTGGVYWTMAFDERVKAGILGSGPITSRGGKFAELIAPRLLMCLWGTFDDGGAEGIRTREEAANRAHSYYEGHGASDNLLIRRLDCGHRFVDTFKWEAYRKLKTHFGILPERHATSLVALANKARKATLGMFDDKSATFAEISDAECKILADPEAMTAALAGLFLNMSDRSSGVALEVSAQADSENATLTCVSTCEHAFSAEPGGSDFETLRGVRQTFFEHDAEVTWEQTENQIICRVSFPTRPAGH